MLKILVRGIDEIPSNTINDAEMAFDMVALTGDEVDRKLINFIEKGEYLNQEWFTDRFGGKCSTTHLSTGCKAALAIHHMPDVPINCAEMGDNALSYLIMFCQEGTIIIHNKQYAFITRGSNGISVSYRGCEFTDFDYFADYMYHWWPDPPAGMIEYDRMEAEEDV